MREVLLKCNICDVSEDANPDFKLYGLEFNDENKLHLKKPDDQDIHICSICLAAIKIMSIQEPKE